LRELGGSSSRTLRSIAFLVLGEADCRVGLVRVRTSSLVAESPLLRGIERRRVEEQLPGILAGVP
jgi:hypothetical protein